MKFKSKFELGAKARWNLHLNSSLGQSRGKMWIQILAGREAEVEFGSKIPARGEAEVEFGSKIPARGEAEVEFGSKFQLGAKPR